MIDDPADGRGPIARLSKQAAGAPPRLRGFYAELCKIENLQLAYTEVKKNFQDLGIDALALEAVERKGVEKYLRQLSDDLQARTYHPRQRPAKRSPEGRDSVILRDLVVQAALKLLLEPIFPPAFPKDPGSEKTIKWLAGNIEKGFSRVYAVNVEECLGVEQHECLLATVRQRIEDPDLLGLLASILTALTQPDYPHQGLLAPLLANIVLESIDPILQQTRAFGREENFLHVHCARVANQIVILLDQDARYDWLLPAVQKRLREELSNLHYDLATVETQSIDMTRGGQLRFLGFGLCLVKGRYGEARVQYRRLEETHRSQADSRPLHRRRYYPLRFVRPYLSWIGRQWICQVVRDTCRSAQAIQVGWQHLPITLFPVLLFFFGCSSPMPWLCLTLIFVCNWRWPLSIVRSAGVWARRHKREVVMGACALAALICLYPLASELHANLSRESAVTSLPTGFYFGQYNKGSPWDAEWVHYGLYVPPHLKGQKGPFPLIVYLHGYGERTKKRLFAAGLPRSIANRFGPNSRNGLFEFVAFFPLDPTGKWQSGSAEVEGVMRALDDVIRRHRIDPARVYLTGVSAGGNGVWNLAQAYPDKWAAVVPVSSFISPDLPQVRHLPVWIFHGGKDNRAPVKRERTLVQQLREAKADVRYTEVPNKGHIIWQDAYDPKALYDWLLTKRKD